MSNIERCKKLIQQYLFHLKQNINLDSLTCSLDCIKNPYLLKPYKYCKCKCIYISIISITQLL